jgi:voltage-gated potassium channel
MDMERRKQVYEAVDRTVELPMLVLSLMIAPLLLLPIVLDLSHSTEATIEGLQWVIWGIFAAELTLKTYLAPHRLAYLRAHWFDLFIVILPFLRPLRLLRSARALRLLAGFRMLAFTSRAVHSGRMVLDRYGLKYVLLAGLATFFVTTMLVGYFEQDAGGNIEDYEDAFWWAITTITTVGYGDRFPITPEGRGIAVLLMITGISLFSFITANIAAFLVSPNPQSRNEPTLTDVLNEVRALEQRLIELQEKLEAEPIRELDTRPLRETESIAQ